MQRVDKIRKRLMGQRVKTVKMERQPVAPDDELISQAKAAQLCGLIRAAIEVRVRKRHFRSVKREGRALVYLSEVKAFARGEMRNNGQ